MNTVHNKKAANLLLGLGGMAMVMSGTAMAGIDGSAHDMAQYGSFSGGQICVTCHVPHNGAEASSGPLWNHALSTASYNVYTSTSLDAANAAGPSGASKLCLSCHDGTVAVDNFGGIDGGTLITDTVVFGADGPNRNLGTDLTNDHPFSFNYDDVATADAGIFASSKAGVTVGSAASKQKSGTLKDVLLGGTTDMQCTSCHDVHNEYTASSNGVDGYRLLKISLDNSGLCLTCHDK